MLYDVIKDITMSFYNKCSKYSKEQLTPEFCDMLFDETVNEQCMINKINSAEARNIMAL